MISRMWKCDVCGYVHRGETPVDVCPICGVGSERFSPMNIAVSAPAAPADGKGRWRCVICSYTHEGEAPERCPVCAADRELFVHDGPREEAVFVHRKKIIIVGEGVAGITAAEQVVAHGGDHVDLTMISAEDELPYYRLNLTRLMADQIASPALIMKDETWFSDHRVRRVQGQVVSIDPARRRLMMKDGDSHEWDALILACGAHPFVPPISGAQKQGVHALRTMADARAIMNDATSNAHVVIVGCGLLGLETAGALASKVCSVTVLENAPWAMVRQLNQTAAGYLVDFLKLRHIDVITGVSAREIEGGDRVTGVMLTNGVRLDADLVVVSTGVRPNIHMARDAGMETSQGIVVDDFMNTSVPGIFAAGDVAEHRGHVYGLWPASFSQGFVAGTNAAGGEAEFKSMAPFNQLKVLDVDVYSIGLIAPTDGSYDTFETGDARRYCYLVIHDRRIVGAVLYGDTTEASIISSAIEGRVCIDELHSLFEKLPGFLEFANR